VLPCVGVFLDFWSMATVYNLRGIYKYIKIIFFFKIVIVITCKKIKEINLFKTNTISNHV
jgi:hypothetical protein